jgi:hypothetical protein
LDGFPGHGVSSSQHASILSHQGHEITPEQLSTKPASVNEVRTIVGPLDDDAMIARIVAMGATAAEVLEAYRFMTDDQLGIPNSSAPAAGEWQTLSRSWRTKQRRERALALLVSLALFALRGFRAAQPRASA